MKELEEEEFIAEPLTEVTSLAQQKRHWRFFAKRLSATAFCWAAVRFSRARIARAGLARERHRARAAVEPRSPRAGAS